MTKSPYSKIPFRGCHGYLLRKDVLATFDYPGASRTRPFGMNARGDIVGTYTTAGVLHGFRVSGEEFTTVDVPGASGTGARGINSQRVIVGEFRATASRMAFCLARMSIRQSMFLAPRPPMPLGSTRAAISLVRTPPEGCPVAFSAAGRALVFDERHQVRVSSRWTTKMAGQLAPSALTLAFFASSQGLQCGTRARKVHIAPHASVPVSVSKRGPRTILRHWAPD